MTARRRGVRCARHATLLAATLLAACGESPRPEEGQVPTPVGHTETALPPPRPVAGMPGLLARSRVTFYAAPDVPHELVSTYVFPDRARWWMGIGSGAGVRRTLHARYGERCFFIASGSSQSVERTGKERREQLLQMELRRALFLWPDGFAWRGEQDVRRADLGAIGFLQARLDGEGRLVELASLDRDGLMLDTYGLIQWRERGGRAFPEAAELSHRGQPIWKEEVLAVETDVHLFDAYFLPPDRREVHRSGSQRVADVQTSDLPPACELRLPLQLEPGAPWSEVLAAAESLRAERTPGLAAQGLELDATRILELGPDGRPESVVLRLEEPPASVPEGWTLRPGSPALTRRLSGPEELTAAALEGLRSLVPPQGHPGRARVQGSGPGSAELALVQPILPPRQGD